MNWRVFGEYDTLKKLTEGFSIARFGDGECSLMTGGGALREPPNERLSDELRETMLSPPERCLRGILIVNPDSPKVSTFRKYEKRQEQFLRPGHNYYSAHISRPDHAPWIESEEYAELAHTLWRRKRVAVVCETPLVSTYRAVSLTAGDIIHVPCPHREAYAVIDDLESAVVEAGVDVAVMSVGPTATCLANRLSKRGIQALDFGRMGSLIIRHTH